MAHLLTESLHNNLRSLFGCHIWKPANYFLSSHLRPPRGPVNWFVIEFHTEFCMKYHTAEKKHHRNSKGPNGHNGNCIGFNRYRNGPCGSIKVMFYWMLFGGCGPKHTRILMFLKLIVVTVILPVTWSFGPLSSNGTRATDKAKFPTSRTTAR